MPYERCPICKRTLYEWRLPHVCPPAWEVHMPDYMDEAEPTTFYSDGADEEQVAEQYAASRFDGEGSEWEIWVRKDEDVEWKKFDVSVEPVPSFTAVKKESDHAS